MRGAANWSIGGPVVCQPLVVAFAISLSAPAANAGVDAFKSVQVDGSVGGAALDGYVVNRILIDFSGQWTSSQAWMGPFGPGSIYQHPEGGITPPEQLEISIDPALALDTFVAAGSSTAGGPWGDPSTGCLTECNPPLSFDDSKINILWSPSPLPTPSDQSDFLIMQLTLRDDVSGTAMFLASADGSLSRAQAFISQGVLSFVPEPASGLLLGLALAIGAAQVRVARSASQSVNRSIVDDPSRF